MPDPWTTLQLMLRMVDFSWLCLVRCRDGVLEATALASRRLEASWRVLGLGLGLGSQVLGLGLGLGSQVFGLGLGLEPKVFGLGPKTVLALLVFKQILYALVYLKPKQLINY